MKRKSTFIAFIISFMSGLLSAMTGILGNIVASRPLPPAITPYLEFAWPAFGLVTVLGIAFAVWEVRKEQERDRPTLPFSSQNRTRLLAKVHAFWITGVLEQSLHGAALIELGLYEQPEAIENPWHLVLQEPNRVAHPLPPGTHIAQVYDDAGGELLILGAPGSGKTTLLLELARELLKRAQQDDTHLLPVVFNLSSWVVKRQPIPEWLVEELNTKYQVPRPLAQAWVDAEQVLPLLDGLDEIAPAYHRMCIEAINAYRQEHGLIPIVVCSRSADYFAQRVRVLLNSVVVIQPLSVQQIDAYLSSAGEKLTAVRVALESDSALQELATTPLMLSVLVLAYSGKPVEDVQTEGSSTTRWQVFAAYTQGMLQRRGTKTRYTPQQTLNWLAWLARQMKRHSQTVFYIERMQPDWLPEHQLRWRYRKIVNGLLGGLIGGSVGGLAGALVGGLLIAHLVGQPGREHDEFVAVFVNGLLVGLIIGLLCGLVAGLLIGGRNKKEIEIHPAEILVWSWLNVRRDLVESLVIGLVGGLVFWRVGALVAGQFSTSVDYLIYWLVYELAGGLVGGLVGGLTFGLGRILILPQQELRRFVRRGVLLGLIVGLMEVVFDGKTGGTIGELFTQPAGSVLSTPGGRLGIGLLSGLVAGLIFGLLNGFSSEKLDEHNLAMPNQGIRRSILNGVFVGLLIWFLFWLLFELISILAYKFLDGIVCGLLLGLVFGLLNGGVASIQHMILRLFLWRAGSMPWNYPHFLDYTSERILLHKVGGGYIFVHRLLLEYFATLDTLSTFDEVTKQA